MSVSTGKGGFSQLNEMLNMSTYRLLLSLPPFAARVPRYNDNVHVGASLDNRLPTDKLTETLANRPDGSLQPSGGLR